MHVEQYIQIILHTNFNILNHFTHPCGWRYRPLVSKMILKSLSFFSSDSRFIAMFAVVTSRLRPETYFTQIREEASSNTSSISCVIVCIPRSNPINFASTRCIQRYHKGRYRTLAWSVSLCSSFPFSGRLMLLKIILLSHSAKISCVDIFNEIR